MYSIPRTGMDVAALAAVMAWTPPELWGPVAGETLAERRARLDARADIVEELLRELAVDVEVDGDPEDSLGVAA